MAPSRYTVFMQVLPPIEDRIIRRPGSYQYKIEHYIPDLTYDEFWEDFYNRLSKIIGLRYPIKTKQIKIDEYFGHFGLRFHPIIHTANYFHIGIDILADYKTPVYPILPGIFEYSGFSRTNGKYVLVSHPDLKTDDGFSLWSIYMHLDKNKIKFTRYQKMLREMSFHTYPNIPIKTTRSIGTVGNSGDTRGMVPRLHLQIELRYKDKIIALDGARIFGIKNSENISANIVSIDEFKVFCDNHKDNLQDWRKIWDSNK